MQDPQLIWRLGRWIARKEGGAAHLVWQDGELIIRVHKGRVVSVEGIDSAEISRKLECEAAGNNDLLEEARALSADDDIPETQAIGAAKEATQKALLEWLCDPDRELEIVEGEPEVPEGSTFSITHAIVELVLASVDRDVTTAILPDRGVLLRRTGSFLDLYGPLRLSEEADLIVAKISGQRTAAEIADRSPHGKSEVLHLLAALVATGMLEPIPVVSGPEDIHVIPSEITEPLVEEEEDAPRRMPIGLLVTGFVVLAIVLGALGFWLKGKNPEPLPTVSENQWSLVVDMGCEPEELQRILAKARAHPKTAHPIAADHEGSEPCWRLAWGKFPNREAAEGKIGQIPESLRQQGFEPHVIELLDDPVPLEELEISGQ